MRFAASLTATGVIGFLLLEALKILLAPAALWLLGVVMLVVKIAAIGFGVVAFIALSVFLYKRFSRSTDEYAT